KGELIGINTAIYGKAQGIGFAIPVDRARRVMKDLVSYGEVRHAWIGLVVQDLTPELAQHFGVRRGVVVAQLDPKGPADARGVARGDAIINVDGRDVASREEFEQRIDDHTEGDRITLTLRRDGRDEEVGLAAATFPPARADELAWQLLGVAAAGAEDGRPVREPRAVRQPGGAHRRAAWGPAPRHRPPAPAPSGRGTAGGGAPRTPRASAAAAGRPTSPAAPGRRRWRA